MMAGDVKKMLRDAMQAMAEVGVKYPEFASRAIESGNVILYIRDQHEAGDETATAIVKMFQSRGIIP